MSARPTRRAEGRPRVCGIRDTRDLREDAGGAVYLEFLIAFMPFFIFFLCLWQLSILFYAKLVVDHAAFSAARAAAVVVAECPLNVGDTDPNTVNKLTESRQKYVKAAAYIALTPLVLDGTIGIPDAVPFLEYPNLPGGVDMALGAKTPSYAPMSATSLSNIRVRINTMFICKIALADVIVCDGLLSKLSGGALPYSMPLSSEAVFPYQGASYTYASTCQ
jgi:hypothetical protein